MSDITDAPVLAARGLRKDYGAGEGLVRAADGVDLVVAPGETVAVMGPSGCGNRPSGGEAWPAGRRIDQLGEKALARMRRTAVGFVFQSFRLMEELTAVDNVELSALVAGRSPRRPAAGRGPPGPRRARRPRRVPVRRAVGGPAPAGRGRPGAQQRAPGGAGRHPLMATPGIGNLDSAATLDVLRLFEDLHEAGQTLVIVTHDARIAAAADRLVSMRDGAFVDETRLTGGTTGQLGALAGTTGFAEG